MYTFVNRLPSLAALVAGVGVRAGELLTSYSLGDAIFLALQRMLHCMHPYFCFVLYSKQRERGVINTRRRQERA